MKRIVLYILIFVLLAFVLRVHAMGLGDMTIHSFLDQPFNAEIELIDVGNIPLSGIKANLAPAEEYDQVGLERVFALSLLSFNIEKNAHGKNVIKVRSVERISEPFMQLLIDLAWADGQIYRSYTVLLDPPNYKFALVKKQLHNIVKRQSEFNEPGVVEKPVYTQLERKPISAVVDHRGVATYGPTVANETVWQIAQRYKTENILLQQMILAIVGTNPQAFTEGNLNGLKEGSQLQIPANSTASRVPLALAKLEVLAHDKAWQSRQTIEHALLPPYIDSKAPKVSTEQELSPLGYPLSLSIIPPISASNKPASVGEQANSRLLPLATSLLSLEGGAAPQPKAKTEFDVASTAIDSVREANALLSEQLRTLQADNKRLQQQLAKREQQMDALRERLHLIIERQGVVGQIIQQPLAAEKGSLWPWVLLLIILGASGGVVYWWLWIRPSSEKIIAPPVSSSSPPVEQESPAILVVEDVKESPVAVNLEEKQEIEVPHQEVQADEHSLEFEPESPPIIEEAPVMELVPEPTIEPDQVEIEPEQTEIKEDNHSIEFVLNPVETTPTPAAEKPVKSAAALTTLLALAKTYIAMDDVETAKQSLKEVLDFGNKKQKAEAKRLLDQLEKK